MIAPVFLVSCPRSGSQLLFELLARSADVWTIGDESHRVFAGIPEMHPSAGHFESGRLDAAQANAHVASRLCASWIDAMRDRHGRRFADREHRRAQCEVTFLEKTPGNCLRVPFLKACFPGARFVFLYRDPCETIASLIDAWVEGARSGRFVTVRHLPGSARPAWCFFLPPEWRELSHRPLAEIAAAQWRVANDTLLDDLGVMRQDDWTTVSYTDLCLNPAATIRRLCAFIGVRPEAAAAALTPATLPLSASALGPPHPDKWRRRETEVLAALPGVQQVIDRLSRIGTPS